MKRRHFLTRTLGLAAAASAVNSHATSFPTENAIRQFDTVIIGAGLFGSAAARHLSQMRGDIALLGPGEPLQRQSHQGAFASHHDNSRLYRVVDPDITWGTLARRSIDRFREIEALSNTPFFHNVGYMMVTPGGLGADWFDLPAMDKVATALGADIEHHDHNDLQQRYPYLAFTPGSKAIYQQRDAGYFNPRLLVQAQQKIAAKQGVTRIHAEAITLSRIGNQKQYRIFTDSELIHARRVLVATGAYANASNLLPRRLDVSVRAAMISLAEVKQSKRHVYPATLYAKTDGEQDFWGLLMPPVPYADGKTYVKTMDGYYGDAPLESSEDLGNWSRSRGHVHHHPVLKRALSEVFPSLEVINTEFKPCLITDTASRYPYIDMLDDNLGIVVGGNGKSAKSSDEIGRIAAGMIHADEWNSSLSKVNFQARFAGAP